eukprot:jgi/Tetstr1/443349/TSEL_031364.t1
MGASQGDTVWDSRARVAARALGWLAAFSISVAFWAPRVLFAWHPLCMSLAFLALMTEGLLRAVDFRPLEKSARVAAIQRHGLVQGAALVLLAAGYYAIYLNKERLGKPHLTSYHSKFGLATALLTVGSALGGVLSFRKLGLIEYVPEHLHATIKGAHRKAGAMTWVLSLITIQLALTHQLVAAKGVMKPLWQLSVLSLAVVGLALLAAKPRQPPPLPYSAGHVTSTTTGSYKRV